MIEVKHLNKKIGNRQILSDINITVNKGSIYGIIGVNGAGKTTLIRHLIGSYKADSGEVLYEGMPVFENNKLKGKSIMIVQISKERMEELLPENIKETDVISNNAKKVLTYLLNQWLVNKKARESGYVVASNKELSEGCKINGGAVMTAVQELIEHNLVLRKAGVKRTQGQTPQASEYTILFNNLRKPLKKNDFETLFGEFCPDYTNANTNAEALANTKAKAELYQP